MFIKFWQGGVNLTKILQKVSGQKSAQNGFALPTVLIMSIILLAIGTSTIQVGAAISRSLTDQHWNRLAKTAAQAGVSFASSCVNQGFYSWNAPLNPTKLCDETAVSGSPSLYIGSGTGTTSSPSRWRSTYTIDPPVVGSDSIIRDKITGIVEVLSPSNIVVKTYTWNYDAILSGAKTASQFTIGDNTNCVITTEAYINCSGYNDYGQLGDNSTINRSTPVKFQVPGDKASSSVYVSDWLSSTCALTLDQLVYCAGDNTYGQLGDGTYASRDTPVQYILPAGKYAAMVKSNYYVTCVLTVDQLVYCSGENSLGQLGDGTTANRNVPQQFKLPVGKFAADVDIGIYVTCVLTTDQLVYCAGNNNDGAIGNGTASYQEPTPSQFVLPGGKTAAQVTVNHYHTCVMTNDKLVYCAGQNGDGQLGNGNTTHQRTPVLFSLPAGKQAERVNTRHYNTCVLTIDQLVYCAGDNTYGQLSDNTNTQRSTAVQFQLPAGKFAADIKMDHYHACVLTIDKLIYCSGYNNHGQLGDGTISNRNTAVQFQLPAGKTAALLKTSLHGSCALTTDKFVYCAGDNTYGQLGDGTTNSRSTPVRFTLF